MKYIRGGIDMTYSELKQIHSEESNSFEGIFFAFSNKQFEEGMQKIGLNPEDTKKIYSLGGGGYILKTRNQAFKDMFKRNQSEMSEAKKDNKFLLDALTYELCNHEYCITWDSEDALRVLNLKREDIPNEIYKEAIRIASIDY